MSMYILYKLRFLLSTPMKIIYILFFLRLSCFSFRRVSELSIYIVIMLKELNFLNNTYDDKLLHSC